MLYEVTLFGTLYNQQVVNRFNYVSTGIPAAVLGSFALMDALGFNLVGGVPPTGKLFEGILAQLSVAYTATSCVVRAASLYSPEDFYEAPYLTPEPGNQNGDCMAPFVAYGFRTNRVRLDIARGTKRFAGCTETDVGTGGVITSTRMSGLAALAELMSDVVTYDDEGNTISFSPCVVQKQEYETPSGSRAYRYYPTLEQQLEHTATGIQWQPYDTVRTQTSRQYGRGA